MAKPSGAAVAQAAAALLEGNTIPYVAGGESLAEMDCQGLVEYCVRTCGGTMAYAGSNDMFRNACAWLGTLDEANARGRLVPGAALFILQQDGSEPVKYRADGLGNALHVGLYTGAVPEVVHASASKGIVCASTLKNAWTHAALLKAVDYGQGVPAKDAGCVATTCASSGSTVNMRKAPSGEYMLKIPLGVQLQVLARSDGWSNVRYGGFDGWVDEAFLRFANTQDVETESMGGDEKPSAWGKVREALRLLNEATRARDE